MTFLSKILPEKITNELPGKNFTLYFFWIIIAFSLIRSLIHIFSPDGGAQSIASIPLDSYSNEANATVIFMFAVWGLSQLLMCFVYIIIAWKYKSLIPLMYLFVFLEYSGRTLIGHAKPVETIRTAPGEVGNYLLIPLSLVMFLFSIKK